MKHRVHGGREKQVVAEKETENRRGRNGNWLKK
jgi:hypothetical protein